MDLGQILPKPDLLAAKIILAVQPHYDDNDIAAGGTLAALSEAGADVYYLTVTDDLVGVLDHKLTPQQAARQISAEAEQAGAVIGVRGHFWLNYPDAGHFDHFDLRRAIIQHIRMLKPDLIFTVDPWTPYEAHTDHIRTGLATAEAAILYGLTRLPTDPQVDTEYQPHNLNGIIFYNSWVPNTYFDITRTRQKKHTAMDAYKAEFSADDFSVLHMSVELMERMYAGNCATTGCTHAEGLKVLNPRLLHCVGETWKF
jgi:LmbE family N-acetylglucosaminyl deacetylase